LTIYKVLASDVFLNRNYTKPSSQTGVVFYLSDLSSPEIAIHKTIVIKDQSENQNFKCAQRNYRATFKLEAVQKIERGEFLT